MDSAAVIVAFAIAYFLVFGGLEDCIDAWQNGKAKIEEQKTLGKLADTRTAEQVTRQAELKLEGARLDRDKQLS